MKPTKQEQAEAVAWLKENIKEGMTIYTILKSVSASGMFRRIDLIAILNGEPVNLNFYYLRAVGASIGELGSRNAWEKGIGVSGCGMDMGFHLVSNLAYILTDNKDYKILQHRWL